VRLLIAPLLCGINVRCKCGKRTELHAGPLTTAHAYYPFVCDCGRLIPVEALQQEIDAQRRVVDFSRN
jgi:hypothetical protein